MVLRSRIERKRAEEALYEAEQVFRTLIENSPDIIARYDHDCRRTYVNPTYLKIAEIAQQELLATAPTQRSPLPAPSAAVLQNLLSRVLDNGVTEAIDVIWPKADGIDYWYNIYAFPEFDREGRVVSVMTVSRDITERKQGEEALQAANAYNRSLIEASLDPLVTINSEGRITDVNTATEKVTGRRRDELIGTDFCDYFTEPQRAKEGYRQAFKDGAVKDYELQIRHRDGYLTPVIYNASVYRDSSGAIAGLFVAARDITARKRTEDIMLARFRLVEYSASHSLDELLHATLDEVEALTDSSIGFYHFVENDQRTLLLQAWSTRTLREMCTAEGKGLHYDIDEAGVWVDCVHERKPVIHNDYSALPHRKGMPAGHAECHP